MVLTRGYSQVRISVMTTSAIPDTLIIGGTAHGGQTHETGIERNNYVRVRPRPRRPTVAWAKARVCNFIYQSYGILVGRAR